MSRNPRSLSEIDRWKASEFRILMLHTDPVLLKSKILDHLADNFMVLHVPMSILCSPLSCTQHLEYVEWLLIHLVRVLIEIYGAHAESLNIHCLIPVSGDVRVPRLLHGYSALPFENYMPRLKSMLESLKSLFSSLTIELWKREHWLACPAEQKLVLLLT